MFDWYTALCMQASRVRCCGITRAEMIVVGTEARPQFVVVLRANDELWDKLRKAPRYTYPVDAADAIATMARPLMPHVPGQIMFTANEALVLGLASDEELGNAGISNIDGVYHVPNAMLDDEETFNRMQQPTTPGLYWAYMLNKLPLYHPEEHAGRVGLSFVILPEGRVTGLDATTSTMIDPGWNWANTMDQALSAHIQAQLLRNLPMAQPLGM
jgi:hypothetical protein